MSERVSERVCQQAVEQDLATQQPVSTISLNLYLRPLHPLLPFSPQLAGFGNAVTGSLDGTPVSKEDLVGSFG